MMACQGVPLTSFLGDIAAYIDCQAQAIGAGGYQALAAPGSTLSLVLTGLLTLFIALFGYRMLFGQTPGMRDGVLAAVKIGIVLALALGWPAYRTLIYDVALKGPAELASEIGTPAGLPGAEGGLVPRLDNADRLLLAFTQLGPGEPLAAPTVPRPGELVDSNGRPLRGSTLGGFALDGARIFYLTGTIAALAAVRLTAGLMLALGPFFIAFVLFEGTRGLFEGWLRVLGAAALGAIGTSVALGVELALLEPWLANLIALRQAGYATPGAPVELFVMTLVFGIVLVALIVASARVAYGFRLPAAWRTATAAQGEAARTESLRAPAPAGEAAAPSAADRSRAVAISDAVAANQRREAPAPAFALAGEGVVPLRHSSHPGMPHEAPPPVVQPLGQTFPRRTVRRHSASAHRRDRKA